MDTQTYDRKATTEAGRIELAALAADMKCHNQRIASTYIEDKRHTEYQRIWFENSAEIEYIEKLIS